MLPLPSTSEAQAGGPPTGGGQARNGFDGSEFRNTAVLGPAFVYVKTCRQPVGTPTTEFGKVKVRLPKPSSTLGVMLIVGAGGIASASSVEVRFTIVGVASGVVSTFMLSVWVVTRLVVPAAGAV